MPCDANAAPRSSRRSGPQARRRRRSPRSSAPASTSSASISATASSEDHQARIDTIRALEKETGRPIGILADLQGPKLRVGTFADGQGAARKRASISASISSKTPGDRKRAPLPHPEIFAALEPGTELLLNDGNIRLKVETLRRPISPRRVVIDRRRALRPQGRQRAERGAADRRR